MMSDLWITLLGYWPCLVLCHFGFALFFKTVSRNLSGTNVCTYAGGMAGLLCSLVGYYLFMLVIYGDYIVS